MDCSALILDVRFAYYPAAGSPLSTTGPTRPVDWGGALSDDTDTGDGATILRTALRAQRRDVTLAAVLVTVHQIGEVLVPVTIGAIIDRAVAPGDAGAAVRWLLVLAVQFAVLSAAGCTAVYVDERARRDATHLARTRLAARVLHPGGGAERALPGEIVSLSTVETARIGDGVGAMIVGIGAVAGVLAGAVILFATSFWLGLAVVVGLPVVLLIVQAVAEPLVARADEHQLAVGAASGVAADLLRGLRVVKGLGADAAASARYRTASGAARDAGLEANRVRSAYAGFTLGVAGAFVILVAWLGARQALDGHIRVGALVAALGVTQFLVGPLARLAYAGSELAQARASSEHLDAALQAPPAVTGGSATLDALTGLRNGAPVDPGAGGSRPGGADEGPAGDGRSAVPLRLDRVRYKGLAGTSFAVGPGEMVAVVCSPAEAAALVDVLDRSSDPEAGTVTVGDLDHATLTLDAARRAVTVAHHDGPLFAGTLRANVTAAAGRAAARAGTDGAGRSEPNGEADGGAVAAWAGIVGAGRSEPSGEADGGAVAAWAGIVGAGRSEPNGEADGGAVAAAAQAAGGAVAAPTRAGARGGGGTDGDAGAAAMARPDSAGLEGGDEAGGEVAWLGPVLAAAGLEDVVTAVEGGLDGRLTDEGRSLSGGQRQRVALARALATDAPVLVLHEPTTAVDTATEHRIASGVRSVRAGRTTVVITSSPPLLAAADRVVVMAGGRVVAEGPHADLVAADEDYRRLVLR